MGHDEYSNNFSLFFRSFLGENSESLWIFVKPCNQCFLRRDELLGIRLADMSLMSLEESEGDGCVASEVLGSKVEK
jgi:hypothetical protein